MCSGAAAEAKAPLLWQPRSPPSVSGGQVCKEEGLGKVDYGATVPATWRSLADGVVVEYSGVGKITEAEYDS
jgi:hypothetical protein